MTDRLDIVRGPGTFEVSGEGHDAELTVVQAGPVGVRVRTIVVEARVEGSVVERATRIAQQVRNLPERLVPIEVDPELGGAVLRTAPEALTGRGFFEVELDTRRAVVRRVDLRDGDRHDVDFALTREQLDGLLDQLA